MSVLRRISLVALIGAVGILLSAGPASAASKQTVRCVGSADYCGATVGIAGGAKGRVVTVNLTDTDLKLARVSAIGAVSSTPFTISKASYRLGGSQYRFTLNASKKNRKRARIVLLFSAGKAVDKGEGLLGGVQTANAIFSVGAGKTVSIVGGGGGTSLCTNDETNTTFVTAGNDENHSFGFDAKSSGSCYFDLSYSYFKVTVKDSSGKLVGSGKMWLGQQYVFSDYTVSCERAPWVGASCNETSKDMELKITGT